LIRDKPDATSQIRFELVAQNVTYIHEGYHRPAQLMPAPRVEIGSNVLHKNNFHEVCDCVGNEQKLTLDRVRLLQLLECQN